MNISNPSLPKLALIAGPTASGKSALGVALAERTNGVIINADSAQVYRDLRILSARPDKAEESKAPHRLYGYRDGAEPCSAADWAMDAKTEIHAAHKADKLPILVGGAGLYLRTLLQGIAPVPDIDPDIRREVRALSAHEAFAALEREDARISQRLSPTDTSRIARALEVIRSTGRSLIEWRQDKVGGIAAEVALAPLILLPPRDWLYQRCDQRFEQMTGPSGLEEVRLLLERNLDPDLPVMRAIGVPQIAALLSGKMNFDEALAAGQLATRQYAKRQYTWFKRQPPEDWPRYHETLDSEAAIEKALMLLGEGRQIA